MFIELVDLLRCPVPHDETWLVATVERMRDRAILDGVLGCPICLAEYPVRAGVVYFAPEETAPSTASSPLPDDAMRIAAGLDLTDAQTVAVLQGRWGENAHLVRSLSPSQLLVLNPPRDLAVAEGISAIVSHGVPLAAASVGAVAFDETATPDVSDALVRSLRPGGAVLGPASPNPPEGVTVVARDDTLWVGERAAAASTIVPLGRRSRREQA